MEIEKGEIFFLPKTVFARDIQRRPVTPFSQVWL